ncbi:MAG: Ribonuclease E, partial [candidate division TM6 bacterium GW2011_GWF2_43_17]
MQIIRDNLDDNVESIVCDSKEVEAAISRFIKEHAPEHLHKIKKYEDPMPIFERFQV